jgi:hypothetical protein
LYKPKEIPIIPVAETAMKKDDLIEGITEGLGHFMAPHIIMTFLIKRFKKNV